MWRYVLTCYIVCDCLNLKTLVKPIIYFTHKIFLKNKCRNGNVILSVHCLVDRIELSLIFSKLTIDTVGQFFRNKISYSCDGNGGIHAHNIPFSSTMLVKGFDGCFTVIDMLHSGMQHQCSGWCLKVKTRDLYMNHKIKWLKDQVLRVQLLFLRTIMEFVLLSCLT